MISIAVCDENINEMNTTAELIKESVPSPGDKNLKLDLFRTPFDLFDALGKGQFYDIYILETELSGFSGVEVARYLRKRGVAKPIIFITSNKNYAMDAFDVDAMQYMMKPVNSEKLANTLGRAMTALRSERRRQIVFKTVDGFYHVFFRNIVYTATDGKYQIVRVKDGRELRVRTTATEMAESLCSYPGFVRCGSSYTLNIYHIDRYDSKTVEMSDGSVLPVPRGAYAKLNTAYAGYFSTY